MVKQDEKKIQSYIEEVNGVIQDMKSKKLYSFITQKLPYIEDYHLDYITRTDTLKDAKSLDEIFLNFARDMTAIVAEEGFGIKEYDTSKEQNSNIIEICEEIDEMFPFYLDSQIAKEIKQKIEKLEIKGKIDTLYYSKLKEIDNKLQPIKEIFSLRFKTQNKLRSLEWKFMSLSTTVTLASIENKISKYKEIEQLETEAQKICKKILKKAKKHDTIVETIPYVAAM